MPLGQPSHTYRGGKLNHNNMQSAQVNQITVQLRERVEMLLMYYNGRAAESVKVQTGCHYSYFDLISEEESTLWRRLCKKDLRRIQKLMTTSMGEGHFHDDTDEFDSDRDQRTRFGPPAHQATSEDDDAEDRQQKELFEMLYGSRDRTSSVASSENEEDEYAHLDGLRRLQENYTED